MQPETKFKNKIRPKLNAIPNSWWVKTQFRAIRGIPDFIGCICGLIITLELKKSKKDKPTKLQKITMEKIRKSGGVAIEVYPENWEFVYDKLLKFSQSNLRGSEYENA